MKESTRIILIIICALLSLLLIGVLVCGIVFRENFYEGELKMVKEEQYSLENIEEIVVNTPRGDVQIFRTNEDKIKIVEKASRRVKEKDLFSSSIKDGTLKIIDEKRNFCFGFCFLSNITYEVYIPASYQNKLSIKTTSGDIELNGEEESYQNVKLISVSGDIKLKGKISTNNINMKTTSGDIEMNFLNSTSIEINSVSGDIDSRTIEGKETKINTTSGDIELEWIKSEVEVISVSGDVELDYFSPIGNSNFKTTSGEIEVMLDKKASVKLHGDSVSGDIRFPNSESILGSGENSISFKTVSGDIKVRVIEKK
ncbi:MAG: DUF4097 domain-containing protein [Bacilli bacterium]|nr:DUF4097 domain-containing protein [Bacilli bacterium]